MSDPLSLPGHPVFTHSVECRSNAVVSQLGVARAYFVGKRFGNLVVTSLKESQPESPGGYKKRVWECRCDCGKTVIDFEYKIKRHYRISCGCVSLGKLRESGSEIQSGWKITETSWRAMKQRCAAPEGSDDFENYAKRGITVCGRWKFFSNFIKDMGERPDRNHTIERINNSLGYFPKNCRWATRADQNINKRTNKFIEFNGCIKTVSQWAASEGISKECLRYRINAGWPVEKVLSK